MAQGAEESLRLFVSFFYIQKQRNIIYNQTKTIKNNIKI